LVISPDSTPDRSPPPNFRQLFADANKYTEVHGQRVIRR
jgi:hypothetical protein